jgi:hypothetical protein
MLLLTCARGFCLPLKRGQSIAELIHGTVDLLGFRAGFLQE